MIVFQGKTKALKTGLSTDENELVVGDVHGCAEQLQALLDSFVPKKPTHLTFLGDLIDRGPNSIKSIEIAYSCLSDDRFTGVTLLTGNHEAMMLAGMNIKPEDLDRYDVSQAYDTWFHNGGDAFLDEIEEATRHASQFTSLEQRLQEVIGDGAFQFLFNAERYRRVGSLLLCHAGMHPHQTIETWFSEPEWPVYSESKNWCWVRRPFLEHTGAFPENVFVVHGHTFEIKIGKAKMKPKVHGCTPLEFSAIHTRDNNRLGLDGGSFQTGIVTAALFEKGRYRIIAAADEKMANAENISIT